MIVGIDLAGSPKRATGYAVLHKNKIKTSVIYNDEDILSSIKDADPSLVAIDAPLSLPKGRKDIDKRDENHFRQCDIQLRKLGIRFFPVTLGPMRMLTKRGMRLKHILKNRSVIEVFPGATYDIFNIPRKNIMAIGEWVKKMGFLVENEFSNQDEADAAACAITGWLYRQGNTTSLNGVDGAIIVPKNNTILK